MEWKTTYGDKRFVYPTLNMLAEKRGGTITGIREPLYEGDICFSIYWGDDENKLKRRYRVEKIIQYVGQPLPVLFVRRLDTDELMRDISGAYFFPIHETKNGTCPLCGASALIHPNNSFDCSEGC